MSGFGVKLLLILSCNSIAISVTEQIDENSFPGETIKFVIKKSNSAQINEKRPPVEPESESIFLPLSPQRYHPNEVLEQQFGKVPSPTFDFLDFSAYLVKPVVVDYDKIFAHMKDGNNIHLEPQTLQGLHIDTAVYQSKETIF